MLESWRHKQTNQDTPLPVLQIYNLDQGKSISKTNTIIAISGFLSKNSDKKDEWDKFIKYVDEQSLSSNVMALNWEAKSVKEIWSENKETLKSKVWSGGLQALATKSLSGVAQSGLMAAKNIYDGVQSTKEIFLQAKR